MLLVFLASLSTVLGVTCAFVILRHAFARSIGTGFMVLCIPFFMLAYAFGQFEHRQKGWVVAGFVGGIVLGLVLRVLGGGHGAMVATPPQHF
jgi:translocator protein